MKAGGLQEVSDATRTGRDGYRDLLRVVAIGSVVAGRWLMAVVQPTDDGGATTTNALEQLKGAQVLTLLLQVMPLFFFVGGFVHAAGARARRSRGGGTGECVRARAPPPLPPTRFFLSCG